MLQVSGISFNPEKFPEGTHPATNPEAPLQIILLNHPKGKKWAMHTHTEGYQEAIVIKRGQLLVETSDGYHKILSAGDWMLVEHGGFAAEALTDVEFMEFKNGPYSKDGVELNKTILL